MVLTSDIENVISLSIPNRFIADLTGLEDFTSLEILDVNDNFLLTSLDISNNTSLTFLDSSYCYGVTSLDLSNNVNLTILRSEQMYLTEIDLSSNIVLEELYIGNPDYDVLPQNFIETLNLSSNPELRFLSCSFLSSLESIDLSMNLNLEVFDAVFCSLSELDTSKNSLLRAAYLGENITLVEVPSNNFDALNFRENPNLEILSVYDCDLTELSLDNNNNTILTQLFAQKNPNLFCIDVDDPVAANNGEFPYSNWLLDTQTKFSDDCVLGISNQLKFDFELYPNPTHDVLNIRSTMDELNSIDVFTVSGQKVMSKTTDLELINLSKLSSGIYFIALSTKTLSFTIKISKL